MSRANPMRSIAPFGLRLPPKLRAALEAEADANSRSLNSEITERLRASLPQETNRIESLLLEIRDALTGPRSDRPVIDITRLDDSALFSPHHLVDAIATKPIRPEGK